MPSRMTQHSKHAAQVRWTAAQLCDAIDGLFTTRPAGNQAYGLSVARVGEGGPGG